MAIEELLVNPFPELSDLMEEFPKELPETPEQKERFQVKDKEQAEWCLRQISRLLREQEEIESTAKKEIEKITTWKNNQAESIQKSISFFEYLLTEYHQQVLKENPKAKTIKLPSGNLEARNAQPEYKRDKDAMLPWVEKNRPDYVVIKKDINWAGLKKILKYENGTGIDPDTGEVVPGLTVIDRGTTFSVKTL
jgi:phage host-nuclease inhibitor protein Gam